MDFVNILRTLLPNTERKEKVIPFLSQLEIPFLSFHWRRGDKEKLINMQTPEYVSNMLNKASRRLGIRSVLLLTNSENADQIAQIRNNVNVPMLIYMENNRSWTKEGVIETEKKEIIRLLLLIILIYASANFSGRDVDSLTSKLLYWNRKIAKRLQVHRITLLDLRIFKNNTRFIPVPVSHLW